MLAIFRWSEGLDRMFRIENAAGSNPASATKRPVQGDIGGTRAIG